MKKDTDLGPLLFDRLPLLKKAHRKLKSELKAKNIIFAPYFWPSDDWFCPDGHSGFAVPFYVYDSKLLKLEKKVNPKLEGITYTQIIKLFRHETGHALDNAFHLRKNKKRQSLFGLSSTKYPKSYLPKKYSKKFVRYLPEFYAQSHPDEDWAETFAVWLDPTSNWKSKYANTHALKKIQLVDSIMSNIANKKPKKISSKTPFNINKMGIQLNQYMLLKKKKLTAESIKYLSPLKPLLTQINNSNAPKYSNQSFNHFIKENKLLFINQLHKNLSQDLFIPKYYINYFLEKMMKIEETKQLTLKYSKNISKKLIITKIMKNKHKIFKKSSVSFKM